MRSRPVKLPSMGVAVGHWLSRQRRRIRFSPLGVWLDSVIALARMFVWLALAMRGLAGSRQDASEDEPGASEEPADDGDLIEVESRAILQRFRDVRDRYRNQWAIPESALSDPPEEVSRVIDMLVGTADPEAAQELSGDFVDLGWTANDSLARTLHAHDQRGLNAGREFSREDRKQAADAQVALQAGQAASLEEAGFASRDLALFLLESGEFRVGDGRLLAVELSNLADELTTLEWTTYAWIVPGLATLPLIAFLTGSPVPGASIFLIVLGWIAIPWIMRALLRALDRRLEAASGDAGMLTFVMVNLIVILAAPIVAVLGAWAHGQPLLAGPMDQAMDVVLVPVGLLFFVALVVAPLFLVFVIRRGAFRVIGRTAS